MYLTINRWTISFFLGCFCGDPKDPTTSHSSRSASKTGARRRLSAASIGLFLNTFLPLSNSAGSAGLSAGARDLRKSWFSCLSMTMRCLNWNCVSPRRRLCMPSIARKRVGSQYSRRRSSDQRTPVSLKIISRCFFISASLHQVAASWYSWEVRHFQLSASKSLISDFCSQQRLHRCRDVEHYMALGW